ncbi:MAG: CRISPR system precrRNA processing endoribonuclease RAMP protein Cas6 [Candidatus Caldarchaeum sp.]
MIILYDLIAECSDDKLLMTSLPTARLRGLLGQCIKVYSKTHNLKLYENFFKPRRGMVGRDIARKIPTPKPYIINPPTLLHRDTIQFRLTVFGHANQLMPHILKAIKKEHGKLQLLEATIINDVTGEKWEITDDEKRTQQHAITYQMLLQNTRQHIEDRENLDITLMFLTPVRLTRDGSDIKPNQLKPSDLIRFAARRLFLLDYLYYSAGRTLPFKLSPETVKKLTECADSTTNIETTLSEKILNLKQKTKTLTGKLKLKIQHKGEETLKAVFLLKACEYLGIGKHTAYGLGKYTLTYST